MLSNILNTAGEGVLRGLAVKQAKDQAERQAEWELMKNQQAYEQALEKLMLGHDLGSERDFSRHQYTLAEIEARNRMLMQQNAEKSGREKNDKTADLVTRMMGVYRNQRQYYMDRQFLNEEEARKKAMSDAVKEYGVALRKENPDFFGKVQNVLSMPDDIRFSNPTEARRFINQAKNNFSELKEYGFDTSLFENHLVENVSNELIRLNNLAFQPTERPKLRRGSIHEARPENYKVVNPSLNLFGQPAVKDNQGRIQQASKQRVMDWLLN